MRPLGIHCRQAIVKSPRGAHRPKPCKLAGNVYLCRAISAKLIRKWSPQQIAGWLMREHPNEEGKRVSHALTGRVLRSNVPRGGRSIAACLSRHAVYLRKNCLRICGQRVPFVGLATPP
jgi:IS30 family transposase